jgi:hypothetical protein
MNAGFSNLTSLKQQLLSPQMQARTDWDNKILAIGLGVATSFEGFCNREFAYAAGILEVFSGDRPHWFTRRPVVSQFTKVELRFFMADPWTNITGQPVSVDEEKGYIDFGYTLGRRPMQTRLTYNGGYFWEQQEPTNPDGSANANYPTPIPVDITNNLAGIDPGKFMLPNDLLFAWQMQCRKVWEAIDKIGDKILTVGSNARNPAEVMAGLDLIPEVQGILRRYFRYQLT